MEQDFACRGWAHHERRIPCQIWKRPFANVPTTSGSPMVNPRARRTSIGSMLNAKFSRHQLKAQAATLPPQRPPTRDWLRRNPPKRQRSPDREKTKPAPHSFMRASSRGPVTTTPSSAERVAPLLFVKTNRGRFLLSRTGFASDRRFRHQRSRTREMAELYPSISKHSTPVVQRRDIAQRAHASAR